MSTVKPTDKVLVNRAGTDYSVTTSKLMATLLDTDLVLVNRGGVDYKCNGKDFRAAVAPALVAPDIDTVTLSDVAGGDRFTSTAFPFSVTMTEDGNPLSTKTVKAYVTGAFTREVRPQATLSSILSGSATGSLTVTDAAEAAKFQVGSMVSLQPIAAGWTTGWTMTGDTTPPRVLVFNTQGLVDSNDVEVLFIDDKNGVPSDKIELHRADPIHIAGLTVKWRLYDGDPAYPTLNLEYYSATTSTWKAASLTKVGQTGPGDKGDINVYQLAINDNVTGFRRIKGGYFGGRIYYILPTAGGYAEVVSVSGTTITYRDAVGFTGAGGRIYGAPYQVAVAGTKMYLTLDAAGAVSSMQSSDPGFTAWTPAGTGPYTGKLTFPATFPSGNAPDVDITAGAQLTVEVKATNVIGSDTVASNTITPA